MKRVILFFVNAILVFWVTLGCSLMLLDIASYYNIIFEVDWFQLIKRETNVSLNFALLYLPSFIFLIYLMDSLLFGKKKVKKV